VFTTAVLETGTFREKFWKFVPLYRPERLTGFCFIQVRFVHACGMKCLVNGGKPGQ